MTEKLIIFDFDGVLVDSEVLACQSVVETLVESGFDATMDEIHEKYTGISTAGMMKMMEEEYGRPLPDDFTTRMRARARALFRTNLPPIPHIQTALDDITVRKCIASSSTMDGILYKLQATGLNGYFPPPNIFNAEMVQNGKPAPDLFLHAAARMNAVPEQCIVIEDSVAGVTAAVAAGMPVLGFTGGSHIRTGHDAKLREVGATDIFGDMRALPEMLARF